MLKADELTLLVRGIANLSRFAEHSTIPRRTLTRIKAGGYNPGLHTAVKLLEALDSFVPANEGKASKHPQKRGRKRGAAVDPKTAKRSARPAA